MGKALACQEHLPTPLTSGALSYLPFSTIKLRLPLTTLKKMSYLQLFREFGASAAIVVSSGIVVWTNISNQKTITTRVEMSENKIYEKIYETEQALQQQTYRTENALEKKLEQAKQELGQGIDRAQAVATGSALAILDDPKKVAPMQERLKAFAACVRGGGGESCLKGLRG